MKPNQRITATLAILVSLVAGCVNPQAPEKTASGVEKIAVTSGDSYDVLAQQTATEQNKVELLLDGPETYDAMFEAIAGATDHINLETFILADDVIGDRLARVLTERAQAGVVVNVTYDAFGSGMTDDSYFERLLEGGINLLAYNALFDTEIWELANRNHRKLLIIDGKIGFTGGLNFTRKYRFSSDNPPPDDEFGSAWRDTHIRIEGPAVAELQRAFMRTWVENAEGEAIEVANYFPEIAPAGSQSVLVVSSEGGDNTTSPIFEHYTEAIRQAEQRVWILQAYFVPNDELLEALKGAAERGVDVRLIVPRRTDNGLTVPATRSYYSQLLKSGVRIFEYNNTHLHAKTALIDNDWSTVGSSNLDTLSYLYNHELNAIILDQEFNELMAKSYLDDISESDEITKEEWADRGVWPRVKETVARLLKPIL